MTKICIVTPDLIGPIRNGGIGTHCYYLARHLAKIPTNQVTIFFTGPYEISNRESVQAMYSKVGILFYDLTDAPAPPYPRRACEWFLDQSLRIKDFLLEHDFDLVHFQDWQANGIATMQAKNTGLGFEKTKLTLTLHSSTQWIREGMRSWPEHPLQDVMLDYCERYTAKHADLLISPSEYMLNWAKASGWELSQNTLVAPYCFEKTLPLSPSSATAVDLSHLIFFGRLETRKGLELFCRALQNHCCHNSSHQISKITFLGKVGLTQAGVWADQYLEKFSQTLKSHQISVEIITSYDSHQALNFLQESRACVFICSLQDNYPFTVIECLEYQIPVIASKTGGISEQICQEALFETRIDALEYAIEHRAKMIAACRSMYSSEAAAQAWANIQPCELSERPQTSPSPKVSICVAYYNYGKYLPQLLTSLARQTYLDFEVIVLDDGSTERFSKEVFEIQKVLYAERGWRFITKENEGIGATRNFAASHAQGEFIIFMDADNVATENMIANFVQGMQSSKADCLTSHFQAFTGDEAPVAGFTPAYGYTPLGPCLGIGPIANVFGDANFCINREVFKQLGGFKTERSSSYEDYELLVRLALKGYHLDVIPETLFYYRHLDSGFSRVTDQVANQKRITQTYKENLERLDRNQLFDVLLVPLARQTERFTHQILSLEGQLYQTRQALAERDLALKQFDRAGYRAATKALILLDRSPQLKELSKGLLTSLWRALAGMKRLLKA